MNGTSPEMNLHCLNTPENTAGNDRPDLSVLQRQRARMKWQQEQHFQQRGYFSGNELSVSSISAQGFQGLMIRNPGTGEFGSPAMKSGAFGTPAIKSDFGKFVGDGLGYGNCGFEINYALPMTGSCTPAVAAATVEVADTKGRELTLLPEKLNSKVAKESFKKRKVDKIQNLKVIAEEECKEKRIKGCAEEADSKNTEQNYNKKKKITTNSNNNSRETSVDTSRENSKVSEVQKPDFIHVRARRGQATDSHSLAERVRREKISEKMKYLQDLVPGCNKITGKAGMLDEIINYVQSLQRQVEFLSMKLAGVNPKLEITIDDLFAKEMFSASTSNFPGMGISSEIANPAYVQFDPLQQLVSCCGLEIGIDNALRRTISAPISIPQTFLDTSCFNQIQPSPNWDTELQNLYSMGFQQGRSTPLPSQPFTGSIEASNLKMEI